MNWFSDLFQDTRYGLRMLIKSPGFSLVAVLSLALGIGANTAIFSVLNAVLIRPLPYAGAERIHVLWCTYAYAGYTELPPSYNDVNEWRKQSQSFESLAACEAANRNLTDGDTPEAVGGVKVSHGFFDVFGVKPLLGRAFLEEEDSPGGNQVVVISHGVWQRRYAGDPTIIGRTVPINGVRHTVVGVMPPEFQFPRAAELPAGFGFAPRPDVWIPFGMSASDWRSAGNRHVVALARLKQGVTFNSARAELSAIAARLEQQFPESNAGMGVRMQPLRQQIVALSRRPLLMLFGAVSLLMLIACANVAGLLLARATTRRREVAVRAALGAGRMRIFRQMLMENALLAGLGALLGAGFARLGIAALIKLGPANIPLLQETRLDAGTLTFTALLAVLTVLVFGIVPSLQAARTEIQQALKSTSGRVSDTGGRLREGFVVAQIALALTMLVGTGLLIRSLAAVLKVESGLQPDSVLTFQLNLPGKYQDDTKRLVFFEQFRQRLESMSGVQSVGAAALLPMGSGEAVTSFRIEGGEEPKDAAQGTTERNAVAGSYFQAMGIRLTKGRFFTDQETSRHVRRVIINETLARRSFGDEDPIGKRLTWGGDSRVWWEIVGVVCDVKSRSLETPSRPQIYDTMMPGWNGHMTMVVRASGNPQALISVVRAELKAVDPELSAAGISPMANILSNTLAARRFNLLLLGLFAVLALFLTAVGLYGSISYWVNQRTREIGIRLALGAEARSVVGLVMKRVMLLTLTGLGLGLGGAFIATRLLSSQLFGVERVDPLTYTAVIALIIAVAALAACLPSRRATRVNPMEALRAE